MAAGIAFWVQGDPLEEVNQPPLYLSEWKNGRVEGYAGQPNTVGSRARCSGGCSQKYFLVPNLIQLILGVFCRSAPPGS